MQLPWRSLHRVPARAARPSPPSATTLLLVLLAASAAAQWSWQHLAEPADAWLDQGTLTVNGLKAGHWWQVLTHLLVNSGPGWLLPVGLATLALTGRALEGVVGRRHLWQLFVLAGMAGGLGQVSFDALLGHDAPASGPTAGVMGVLLALAYVLPRMPLLPQARPEALRRVKVVHGTLGALAATVVAGTHPPAAGAMVGGLTGCLYMYTLGFGRWTTEQKVPAVSASSSASWEENQNPPKVLAATGGSGSVSKKPRRIEPECTLTTREFIAEKVDPVLEKISREGLGSLTAEERQVLETAREKVLHGK